MSIINLFRMASKFAISHRLIVRVVEHQLEADIVLASLYLSLSLSLHLLGFVTVYLYPLFLDSLSSLDGMPVINFIDRITITVESEPCV